MDRVHEEGRGAGGGGGGDRVREEINEGSPGIERVEVIDEQGGLGSSRGEGGGCSRPERLLRTRVRYANHGKWVSVQTMVSGCVCKPW